VRLAYPTLPPGALREAVARLGEAAVVVASAAARA